MAESVEHERELFRRAQSGDEDAFNALTRRWGARAFGILRRAGFSSSDAEDILQAAFLKLLCHLRRHPTERIENPSGFFLSIVCTSKIDWLRSRSREADKVEAYADEISEQDASDATESGNTESVLTVAEAEQIVPDISSLSAIQKNVIVADANHRDGQAPARDLAEKFGVTEKDIRNARSNGRRKIHRKHDLEAQP